MPPFVRLLRVPFRRICGHYFSSDASAQLTWNSNRVRKTFIDYFRSLGYTYVHSSSVVPFDDQSLLYVNAGMNQFKPIFLGTINPTAHRARLRTAVNSQKCVRASGKHSDLEEVGRDGYHHTFFEMLGSWSFNGHMPKKQACDEAFRLLTDVYGLSKERLFVTYFEGYEPLGLLPDVECKELWRELGVLDDHILGRGVEDNFWEMSAGGGPCGPCTEILYSSTDPPRPDENVELWNIVFMQYNKLPDGGLKSLPAMHIDTGMGLERLCSVLQRVPTTYDTDLFRPILDEIRLLSGAPAYMGKFGEADQTGMDTAYRIVADHARMFTVSITDGITPDSQNAGQILRRIIRNAVFQSTVLTSSAPESGQKNQAKMSLSSLVDPVAGVLGEAYPELYEHKAYVREVVAQEEAKFLAAMTKARVRMGMLLKDSGGKVSAADLAAVYHTYGLPYEIIVSMAQKKGVKVNGKEFEMEMAKHSQRSGEFMGGKALGADAGLVAVVNELQGRRVAMTDDSFKYIANKDSSGQYVIPACEAKVHAIIHNNTLTTTVPPDAECDIVLDRTPFYAEAGGQAGDRGTLRWGSAIFNVKNTFARSGYVFHRGQLKMGGLALSDAVQALVDRKWRLGCMQHHTATHVVMACLERLLGPVRQRSSTMDAESSKLGFWCAAAVTPDLMIQLERDINELIRSNLPVFVDELSLERAKQCPDIRWMLGEYYPETVRVVGVGVSPKRLLDQQPTPTNAGPVPAVRLAKMPPTRPVADPAKRSQQTVSSSGDLSTFVCAELCGGTHVLSLGDIQQLRIVALEGSGSSVKRITFVVGPSATAAEELGRTLREEIAAVWEKVRSGAAGTDVLLQLRPKVVDSIIPFETRMHLLHDILDLKKAHLKGTLSETSQRNNN